MNKKISIIIINYNTKDLLLNCINSIYANCKNLDFEIIVIDNGSKDKSVLALKEFINKTKNKILIIELEKNLGFAKAGNIGAKNSKAEYVLFLNTDTLVKPDSINKLYEFMKENNNIAVSGPQLLNKDESLQNSIDNFPLFLPMIFNKSILRIFNPKKYASKKIKYTMPVEVESIIGACFFVNKKIFDKLNGFDEDYFFFFEETDFCLRAKKNNYKIFFIPKSEIIHFQGKSSEKNLFEIRKNYFKSRYIFLKKHGYKNSQIRILKIVFCIKLLINAIFTFLFSIIIFSKKKFIKAVIYFRLFIWHLKNNK